MQQRNILITMVAKWKYTDLENPPFNIRVMAYIMSHELLSTGYFILRERDNAIVFISDAGGAFIINDISVWDYAPILKKEFKTRYPF